jgi:hypothetical protein
LVKRRNKKMAEIKETYTPKKYPEEAKAKLDALLAEITPTLKELDKLDTLIATTPSPTTDTLKEWARQCGGKGNYIRKKWGKIRAIMKNQKGDRYMEIKLECSTKGITFVDATTKIDAGNFVSPLRVVRDILESYVVSADNNVSNCRLSLNDKVRDNQNDVEV